VRLLWYFTFTLMAFPLEIYRRNLRFCGRKERKWRRSDGVTLGEGC
jgi:hypothetical protein